MPYMIRKEKGARPYKIVKKDTGEVVGSSTTRAKAARSIGYREAAKHEADTPMGKMKAHRLTNLEQPTMQPKMMKKILTVKELKKGRKMV